MKQLAFPLTALLCAALSIPAQGAQRCPGGASWCDDFEHGAARVLVAGAAAAVGLDGATANHFLPAGDGQALLVAPADSALLTRIPYFVEARVRPSAPATAAARKVYLVARHLDENNWIGVSVSFTPGSKRLLFELVRMEDGKLLHLKQVGRTSEAGDSYGDSYHTVRLELGDELLTLYLGGERLTTTPLPFAPGGQAGVRADGGAFDIDDLRIGAAAQRPGRIALARMTGRIGLQAGDAPRHFAVSAFDGDGVSALPFSAQSSDPAVASVAVAGADLLVRAHRPGAATITLTGRDDVNVATTLALTVAPAQHAPARTYALRGHLAPAAHARAVPVDTPLRITFDQAATLGSAGTVRIFRAADDALVDVIGTADDVDTIGYPGQPFKRVVRYQPLRIDGASLTIRPHNARLAYGTDYYVTIDPGVVAGATLGGQPFTGLGRQAGWRFRTRAAPPTGRTLSVDDDGPADFRTVQGALNHAMRALPRAAPVTIHIANGRYEELLYLRGKDKLTLRGQSRDGVVIEAANNDLANPGSGTAQAATSPAATGGRSVLLIEDADLVTLTNLTLRNSSRRAGTPGGSQAEALYFNSENGRLIAHDATFLSEQDTVQVKGYSWFYRTLIAGNVDFIWGYNRAALFERSEIRSVGDSANPASGGYVVQARTVAAGDPGFVFLDSRLTHGPGPAGNDVPAGSTYLARSPGTASTWDNVSYIDCRIDAHVAAAGWAGAGVQGQPAPNPPLPGAGAGWREAGSMDLAGTPLDLAARVGADLPATAQARARFGTRARVFQGFNGGRGWQIVPPAEQ
ncbi:pectinesterase family protein [Massilia sp. DWR3-1-1]|uniref:pectinesterase family protein n=1 Tax=Massilia sp. DWR3-1-1 TaxID=2804559 RepID=UPI003CF2F711